MIATVESLLQFEQPGPLKETFKFPINDWEFEIEGLKGYTEAQIDLGGKLDKYLNDKYLEITFHGETYKPIREHIRYAVWCAVCVRNPALTVEQWLSVAHDAPGLLESLFNRILIMCRFAAEVTDGEVTINNGIDAAKKELSSDASPLEVTAPEHSQDSVSTSSDVPPENI